MIQVQSMKPFYTKVSGNQLRIVFAYQYFTVEKDDEVYNFVPIEGKEIIIDLPSRQVQNLSTVFVFQRANKFLRLPLYQILLISNINEFLNVLIDKAEHNMTKIYEVKKSTEIHIVSKETDQLIDEIMEFHMDNLVDKYLAAKDYEALDRLFNEDLI